MNKLLTVFTIVFLILTIRLKAQDLQIGGGLSYGTGINNLGINFRGTVKLDKQWSITPHFNFFLNKKNSVEIDKWNAMNLDGHYSFIWDRRWCLYPLLGIILATTSVKVSDLTYANTYLGMNLGVGSEFHIDNRFSGFGEIKYVISKADQLVIGVGILYEINH